MPTDISNRQLKDTSVVQVKTGPDFLYFDETSVTNSLSPYAVVLDDHLLLVDSTTGVVTINLPALAGTATGRPLVFKDSGGVAGTNNITISPFSGDDIDGDSSDRVLTEDNAFFSIVATSTQWVQV